MGVRDVERALQAAAGDDFSISDLTLHYKDSGTHQVLAFNVQYNGANTKFTSGRREVIVDGHVNPMQSAGEIGAGLRSEVNEPQG